MPSWREDAYCPACRNVAGEQVRVVEQGDVYVCATCGHVYLPAQRCRGCLDYIHPDDGPLCDYCENLRDAGMLSR